jgi:hypothetical protein
MHVVRVQCCRFMIHDPGSGAFLSPGPVKLFSGSRIPDLDHFYERIFWVKNT